MIRKSRYVRRPAPPPLMCALGWLSQGRTSKNCCNCGCHSCKPAAASSCAAHSHTTHIQAGSCARAAIVCRRRRRSRRRCGRLVRPMQTRDWRWQAWLASRGAPVQLLASRQLPGKCAADAVAAAAAGLRQQQQHWQTGDACSLQRSDRNRKMYGQSTMACAGCQCRRACIIHFLHLLTSCSCSASGSCCGPPQLAAAAAAAAAVLRSAPQPPCRLLRAPSGETAAAALAAREAPWPWRVCRRTAGQWRRAWLHRWMPSAGAGSGESPDTGEQGGNQKRGSSLLGMPSSRRS